MKMGALSSPAGPPGSERSPLPLVAAGGATIQATGTAKIHEQLVAMNEALMLGTVRQHELTEAAEMANAQLQLELTKRRQVEEELREKNNELAKAMARVKSLSGLLPICSGCKKIRDDEGYWSQVESYISKHSEATFTHGLCPICIEKYFPGLNGE